MMHFHLTHARRAAHLAVWFGIAYAAFGLIGVVLYPAGDWFTVITRLMSAWGTAVLITAIGALTLAVVAFIEIMRDAVLPTLREEG